MTWQTWRTAMDSALYGDDGFYRRAAGPAAQFRTSVHVSPLFADALTRLAHAVHIESGATSEFAVVDVGAGRGELLTQLAERVPPQWRLIGVDVVARPEHLADRVEWLADLEALPTLPYAMLVANEWLDNVPIDVVLDGRLVEVDERGAERPGAPPGARDLEWCARWAAANDRRIEVGWPRDDAWAQATAKVHTGLALAIDYAAAGGPGSPTLTGFRDGREVPPVPDGSCDLTAHVLFESCALPGGTLMTQRHALLELGLSARLPARELARADPAGYLRALSRASEAGELLDPQGLGRFLWLLQPLGLTLPDVLDTVAGSLG